MHGRTVVLLASILAACEPRSQEPPAPTDSPGTTLARCGGSAPAGFESILAGADTAFYTARSRQTLQPKPGVEVKPETDEKGAVTGLRLMARDNDVLVACGCPGGCSPDPGQGHGCVVQFPPGGGDASCTGDCVSDNTCCAGCGFMAPR
jgi:hypothetical protein